MDRGKKKQIDNLWRDSDFGKWVAYAAKGKNAEANKVAEKMIAQYPFSLYEIEKELARKLSEVITQSNEFEDYLKALDEEDAELVEFMISNDTFGYIYNFLD